MEEPGPYVGGVNAGPHPRVGASQSGVDLCHVDVGAAVAEGGEVALGVEGRCAAGAGCGDGLAVGVVDDDDDDVAGARTPGRCLMVLTRARPWFEAVAWRLAAGREV
ncbi:hypothetical protein GCM10010222_47710 [Streptomyces tanashiensis]|nr:hypothetical protein GCM10010222_47710 [Streptomyces tanashiensis]